MDENIKGLSLPENACGQFKSEAVFFCGWILMLVDGHVYSVMVITFNILDPSDPL